MRVALNLVGLCCLGVQASVATQSVPVVSDPRFEVVSIKPAPPDQPSHHSNPAVALAALNSGRFLMLNVTTRNLLFFSYSIESGEVIGAPDWVRRDRYNVEALMPPATPVEDRRAMMRAVLAERFALRVHFERVERRVFALRLVEPGKGLPPGLQRSTYDCDARIAAVRSGDPVPLVEASNGFPVCMGTLQRSGGITMGELADKLEPVIGRVVLDETGLEGRYEFTMSYARTSPQGDVNHVNPSEAPQIRVALEEQLGLRLVPSRSQVEVLIVDSINRPTPN